jgi:hypothetical protein
MWFKEHEIDKKCNIPHRTNNVYVNLYIILMNRLVSSEDWECYYFILIWQNHLNELGQYCWTSQPLRSKSHRYSNPQYKFKVQLNKNNLYNEVSVWINSIQINQNQALCYLLISIRAKNHDHVVLCQIH